jgi:hypothetical protein
MFIGGRGLCPCGHTDRFLERRVSEVEAEVASIQGRNAMIPSPPVTWIGRLVVQPVRERVAHALDPTPASILSTSR